MHESDELLLLLFRRSHLPRSSPLFFFRPTWARYWETHGRLGVGDYARCVDILALSSPARIPASLEFRSNLLQEFLNQELFRTHRHELLFA